MNDREKRTNSTKQNCLNCQELDYLEICDECQSEFCLKCLGLYHGSEYLFCQACFDRKSKEEKSIMRGKKKDSIQLERNKENKKMTKKPLTILPTNQLLQQVNDYIINRKNKRHESKRWIHYCLFLLCWKAGLRITEAINFDYNLEHPASEYKGLYLLRGKGSKERYVYIAPEIIKVLKSHQWKPQQTNRINFFEFLRETKESLHIPAYIELAPHTLRRCFATYNALSGMPLPVLQNVLGHANVRTTALYVKASRLENLLKFKPI